MFRRFVFCCFSISFDNDDDDDDDDDDSNDNYYYSPTRGNTGLMSSGG